MTQLPTTERDWRNAQWLADRAGIAPYPDPGRSVWISACLEIMVAIRDEERTKPAPADPVPLE